MEQSVDFSPVIDNSERLFGKEQLYRISMTSSCHDSEPIPKVANAGKVFQENGLRIQLMYNGVKVIADAYGGEWMTEVIKNLKGCHEPQEEWVYYHIIKRLKEDTLKPKILELGAFWSYYSLTLLKEIKGAEAYLVEPDPNNLAVGKKNFSLNQCEGNFLQAAVGQFSKTHEPFICEDGVLRHLPIENLPSLFQKFCLNYLDVLLLDIQGGETDLLKGGEQLFKNQKVRFVVVSTHHHSISQDSLTHQKCLDMLRAWGGHIIAEHTVQESYSGDGLVVASFSPQDTNFSVNVSYARSKESLFGELEYNLDKFRTEWMNEKKIITSKEFMLSQLPFRMLFPECLARVSKKMKKLLKHKKYT